MERCRRAAGSGLLALLCAILHVTSTTAQCEPGCIGNGSISCMTCSEWCGICSEIGHVDRCNQFGTVHLSLDDGPRGTTPGVLDTLKKYNISASFWVIANLIKGREATLQRIAAEGHYIGDHTWSHPYMNEIYDRSVVEGEVENSRAEIRRVFPNRDIPAYRPPYGELNSNTRRIIEGLSYRIVVWNLDTLDWMGNMSIIAENVDSVMSGTDPASNSWIILMHVTEKIGVCALPAVIERIRYRGYKFVSADECFGTASLSSTPLNPEVYAWRQTQLAYYNGSSQPCVPQYMQGQVFGLNCSAGVSCYEGLQCCGPDNSCANDDWACGDGCLSGACTSCRPMWYPQPTKLPKPLDWPEQSTCPDVPTDATVGGDPNGGGGGDDDGNPGGMSTQLLVIVAVAATAVVIAVGLVIRRKRATSPAPAQPPAPNNDQPGAAVDAEGAVANAGGAACGESGVGEPKMLRPPNIDVFASAIAAATASSLVLASPPTASTVFSPTPGPAPEFGNAPSEAYGSDANHRPASSPSAPRANAGAYSALAMKSPDATVPAMNRRPAQTPTAASSGSASDSKSPSPSHSRFSVDRGGNDDGNADAANPAAAAAAVVAPVRRSSRRGSRSVSGVRGNPTLTAMSMSMALESSPRATATESPPLPLHHHEPGMPAPTAFGESPATPAAELAPATPTGRSPES